MTVKELIKELRKLDQNRNILTKKEDIIYIKEDYVEFGEKFYSIETEYEW